MTDTGLSLVCLPFAGSGAGFFRDWKRHAPVGLTVVPVQLPGREEAFTEEPFTDLGEAAKQLAPAVAAQVPNGPYALFGHSMGALLAYELAQQLVRSGGPAPAGLFVSGSAGPEGMRAERATGLDDDAFVERVREFAGFRHEALDDEDLREVLLPLLRADVAMHENYQPVFHEPLPIPITALRGGRDTLVTAEQAQQWRSCTREYFQYAELPGGHMYLAELPQLLLRLIAGC
ncbi:thioesterase II family protein [Actinacidiphila acididurans]|uniref:Thioesterase n=1 Tax=Actinacidiphila acididurans TaxID=2784346 RepID=A0ABS2U415_9ACTN|nr:alpha/beta fold hydrolase [Actinacidiphila acididurans]MBM9509255.1 thioesterase [Actinacidiphila acididurans]